MTLLRAVQASRQQGRATVPACHGRVCLAAASQTSCAEGALFHVHASLPRLQTHPVYRSALRSRLTYEYSTLSSAGGKRASREPRSKCGGLATLGAVHRACAWRRSPHAQPCSPRRAGPFKGPKQAPHLPRASRGCGIRASPARSAGWL